MVLFVLFGGVALILTAAAQLLRKLLKASRPTIADSYEVLPTIWRLERWATLSFFTAMAAGVWLMYTNLQILLQGF
jgi:hypothetical protein